jgi:hypothetical protein
MGKLTVLGGASVLAVAVGACSSSTTSINPAGNTSAKATATSTSGIETLTGTIAGAAAADYFNSNSNAPPSFPSLVFTGPVNTTIKGPVSLGGGNAKTLTHTFVTPEGNFTVQRTETSNGGTPTVVGHSGSTCYFAGGGGAGTYTVLGSKSTGKFAGATGHGTYVIPIHIAASLPSGTTTCSLSNIGSVLANGTSITFKASGPLTVKH